MNFFDVLFFCFIILVVFAVHNVIKGEKFGKYFTRQILNFHIIMLHCIFKICFYETENYILLCDQYGSEIHTDPVWRFLRVSSSPLVQSSLRFSKHVAVIFRYLCCFLLCLFDLLVCFYKCNKNWICMIYLFIWSHVLSSYRCI